MFGESLLQTAEQCLLVSTLAGRAAPAQLPYRAAAASGRGEEVSQNSSHAQSSLVSWTLSHLQREEIPFTKVSFSIRLNIFLLNINLCLLTTHGNYAFKCVCRLNFFLRFLTNKFFVKWYEDFLPLKAVLIILKVFASKRPTFLILLLFFYLYLKLFEVSPQYN